MRYVNPAAPLRKPARRGAPFVRAVRVIVVVIGQSGEIIGEAVYAGRSDNSVVLRRRRGDGHGRGRVVFVERRGVKTGISKKMHRPRRGLCICLPLHRLRAVGWVLLYVGSWWWCDARRIHISDLHGGVDRRDRAGARSRAGTSGKNLSIGTATARRLAIHGLVGAGILGKSGVGLRSTAVQDSKWRVDADLEMSTTLARRVFGVETGDAHDDLKGLSVICACHVQTLQESHVWKFDVP